MQKHSSKLLITIIVSVAVVILGLIAGWVYVNNQQVNLREQELQQEKELEEYRQEQENERANKDRECETDENSGSDSYFPGLFDDC